MTNLENIVHKTHIGPTMLGTCLEKVRILVSIGVRTTLADNGNQ